MSYINPLDRLSASRINREVVMQEMAIDDKVMELMYIAFDDFMMENSPNRYISVCDEMDTVIIKSKLMLLRYGTLTYDLKQRLNQRYGKIKFITIMTEIRSSILRYDDSIKFGIEWDLAQKWWIDGYKNVFK